MKKAELWGECPGLEKPCKQDCPYINSAPLCKLACAIRKCGGPTECLVEPCIGRSDRGGSCDVYVPIENP